MGNEIDLEKDVLLTTVQVATLVKCSTASVYRWILSGRLPAWKRGGRLMVRRLDLDALLQPVQPRRQRLATIEPRQATRAQENAKTQEILRRAGLL